VLNIGVKGLVIEGNSEINNHYKKTMNEKGGHYGKSGKNHSTSAI